MPAISSDTASVRRHRSALLRRMTSNARSAARVAATPTLRRCASASAGYTLIEVLIVMAVVAILASAAVPQYREHVRRGRVVEAVAKLADHRVRMEQYFADNRSYAAGSGCGAAPAPFDARRDAFELSCTATANTYVLTATGRGGMQGFVFAVDETNLRTTRAVPPGWTTAPNCWVLRPDGSCI